MNRLSAPMVLVLLPLLAGCQHLEGFLTPAPKPPEETGFTAARIAEPPPAIPSPTVEPLAAPRITPPPAPPSRPRPPLKDKAAVEQANQLAQQGPRSDQFINAIMTYDFVDGVLYQVYTAPPRITNVTFEEGESIVSFGAGDTIRWKVVKTWSGEGRKRQEHLLVKPLAPDLDTSLVVTTSRRSYHLRLRSFADTAMVAVRWQYPAVDLFEVPTAQTTDALADPEGLSFGYQTEVTSGSPPRWMPKTIYDDGRKVYIRFPAAFAAGEAPVLYVLNGDETQIVNYRIRGNTYVVDRLFEVAQLRLGQQSQTIITIRRTE